MIIYKFDLVTIKKDSISLDHFLIEFRTLTNKVYDIFGMVHLFLVNTLWKQVFKNKRRRRVLCTD